MATVIEPLSYWSKHKNTVLKVWAICHARDLWKLTRSPKQLRLLCPPGLWNLLSIALPCRYQSSRISLSFITSLCALAFVTHILCNKFEMALVWLISYTSSYIFFKFAICISVLMNLDETCHLKRRNMMWWLLLHVTALWRHAVWMRIVTSQNAWMSYEYSLPNLNRPRAVHKHNPHPLETIGRMIMFGLTCQHD